MSRKAAASSILNPLIVLGLACCGFFAAFAQSGNAPLVLVAAIDGPIGPATTRHVTRSITSAIEHRAETLVLQIDTPGGLETSMRDIVREMLASPIPIAAFVAPPGARAASAGTYILYAAHIAAMAPGTNLGAATPVQIGGGTQEQPPPDQEDQGDSGDRTAPEPGSPMAAKATNDAVAFIRSLATLHGRNADWAEKAVREAASLPAGEALEQKVIDVTAKDLEELLQVIDGRRVTVGGAERTIHTASATTAWLEPDFLTEVLQVIADPNIAFILLLVGVYGLLFEFASPGSIGPGVVGVISLVLGFYALNQLPLDYAGLALLLLGIAFMVAEAVTPAFGVLGIGGLVAFVMGAGMLIDSDMPAFQLSWWTIVTAAALTGALFLLLFGYVWRAYRHPLVPSLGKLSGTRGEVLDWQGQSGHVRVRGERWAAQGALDLKPGDPVRIEGASGLTLVVSFFGRDQQPSAPTRSKGTQP